jgi:hypothetical protein
MTLHRVVCIRLKHLAGAIIAPHGNLELHIRIKENPPENWRVFFMSDIVLVRAMAFLPKPPGTIQMEQSY